MSLRIPRALARVPTAAWICALVAVVNAAGWSLITPPFQGPDEQAHFAYAQLLAETGRLPSSGAENFSQEEMTALNDTRFRAVIVNPALSPVSTRAQARRLRRDLARPLSRKGDGSAGVASAQPPLYYAIETIPYLLGSGGSLIERLRLMRLLSALLSGITVLFVFLFLRETLPGAPWAWTVGALGGALAPLLAFASSAVNPDALLFTVSAAIFYTLARAFRRGLSSRLAVTIGLLTAIGFLTKLNFIGLVPGVILALIILTVREMRRSGHPASHFGALALSIAVSPILIYAANSLLTDKVDVTLLSNGIQQATGHGPIFSEISYAWQMYLPRLPGMSNYFPGIFPAFQIWFRGLVGRYNWLETVFPDEIYYVALIPAGAIFVLFVRELLRRRAAVRARLGELAAYLSIAAGIMLLPAIDSYLTYPRLEAGISEPRYMLPMLALGGLVLALAARGAGRHLGPAAGVVIVVLSLTHDIFSQLLEISRYYG